jgi:hypothetical protein
MNSEARGQPVRAKLRTCPLEDPDPEQQLLGIALG